MSSKSRQAQVGIAGVDARTECHTIGKDGVRRKAPPTVALPVLHWEYKEIHEKDELFELVLVDGVPVIADAWVELWVLAPDGEEIRFDIDRTPFDRFILPMLLYPSILFWQGVKQGDPLYSKKAAALEQLNSYKGLLEATG